MGGGVAEDPHRAHQRQALARRLARPVGAVRRDRCRGGDRAAEHAERVVVEAGERRARGSGGGEGPGGRAVRRRSAEAVGQRDQQLPAGGGALGGGGAGAQALGAAGHRHVDALGLVVGRGRQHDRRRLGEVGGEGGDRDAGARRARGPQPQSEAPGPSSGSAWIVSRQSISPAAAASSTLGGAEAERAQARAVDVGAELDLAMRRGRRRCAPALRRRRARRPGRPRPRARSPARPRAARAPRAPRPGGRARSGPTCRAARGRAAAGPRSRRPAPRRRALRTRSSTIDCWLAGSPPTITTRPAPSMSPSWAAGMGADRLEARRRGCRARWIRAPPSAVRASSWARKPSSTVAVGPTRMPTRPPRPSTSAAAVHARRRGWPRVTAAVVADERGGEAVRRRGCRCRRSG